MLYILALTRTLIHTCVYLQVGKVRLLSANGTQSASSPGAASSSLEVPQRWEDDTSSEDGSYDDDDEGDDDGDDDEQDGSADGSVTSNGFRSVGSCVRVYAGFTHLVSSLQTHVSKGRVASRHTNWLVSLFCRIPHAGQPHTHTRTLGSLLFTFVFALCIL